MKLVILVYCAATLLILWDDGNIVFEDFLKPPFEELDDIGDSDGKGLDTDELFDKEEDCEMDVISFSFSIWKTFFKFFKLILSLGFVTEQQLKM